MFGLSYGPVVHILSIEEVYTQMLWDCFAFTFVFFAITILLALTVSKKCGLYLAPFLTYLTDVFGLSWAGFGVSNLSNLEAYYKDL